jgi:hypothetical protein
LIQRTKCYYLGVLILESIPSLNVINKKKKSLIRVILVGSAVLLASRERAIACLDVNCLDLSIVLKSIRAEFTAKTRFLVATEWCLGIDHIVIVDPDCSSLDGV